MKIYDEWNEVKKDLSKNKKRVSFKQRDVFWINMGQNIGYEVYGKGDEFLRPVIVFKKFSQNTFLGIPLTTVAKDDKFHFYFKLHKNQKDNYAILSQIRLFDAKRLHDKLDKISSDEFENLKKKLKELMDI